MKLKANIDDIFKYVLVLCMELIRLRMMKLPAFASAAQVWGCFPHCDDVLLKAASLKAMQSCHAEKMWQTTEGYASGCHCKCASLLRYAMAVTELELCGTWPHACPFTLKSEWALYMITFYHTIKMCLVKGCNLSQNCLTYHVYYTEFDTSKFWFKGVACFRNISLYFGLYSYETFIARGYLYTDIKYTIIFPAQ